MSHDIRPTADRHLKASPAERPTPAERVASPLSKRPRSQQDPKKFKFSSIPATKASVTEGLSNYNVPKFASANPVFTAREPELRAFEFPDFTSFAANPAVAGELRDYNIPRFTPATSDF